MMLTIVSVREPVMLLKLTSQMQVIMRAPIKLIIQLIPTIHNTLVRSFSVYPSKKR